MPGSNGALGTWGQTGHNFRIADYTSRITSSPRNEESKLMLAASVEYLSEVMSLPVAVNT